MSNIPLNALRVFEAVARNRSFSKGADDLNVSTAAVSSQIRALEERLNQKLFHRKGREISLTGAGRRLLPGVERGMRELRRSIDRLNQDRNQGVLNISMIPSFLQKWLMPRLGEFQPDHPDIDLRISADTTSINFEDTDFHAAIRFGAGHWEGLNSIHLLDDWILPVCSPKFLREAGAITTPEDIQNHTLLFVESEVWDAWFRMAGEQGRQSRLQMLNDSMAILMAAELGEGIALSRWSLVARDVEAGRLVRPIADLVRSDWSYYFVAPPHHMEMPKVQRFFSWLKEQCENFNTPA